MADAVPVSSDVVVDDTAVVPEVVAAPKATKKGASAGISADILAEIRSQVREELDAERASRIPTIESAEDTFKVAGGVKLDSHEAFRQDF